MSAELPEGLYDILVTQSVHDRLQARHGTDAPTTHELVELLVDALREQLGHVLDDWEHDKPEAARAKAELINRTLATLRALTDKQDHFDDVVLPPARLKHVGARFENTARPDTGLRAPWLFSASKGSPALLSELRREIASADHVDVLMSFITMSGVRRLEEELKAITAIDSAGQQQARLRILTTTYIGATEAKAVDWLAGLPGCEVRVSLDGQRTRLHAKAWIFGRRSGFGTAYVGSANLTSAALMGGLEWTVRFTQRAQREMFEQARAHFETLWADAEFKAYDPSDDDHRAGLTAALDREAGRPIVAAKMVFFDLAPRPHQLAALSALALERERGRYRNLVVAATGTGKTVIAAHDYARIASGTGKPRLLFVAHREEIVAQALHTFRQVLRDPNFGQLLTGRHEPASVDHLFATIQSVNSREIVDRYGAGYWHQVVIDECHHIAATSFRQFWTAIEPKYLLGLTATPERTDGQLLTEFFDTRPDGSPAYELRLWHAIDQQRLAPFEYYACDDDTDFSDVPWGSGASEIAAIDRVVTGNDVRSRLVVREWARLTDLPQRCKAVAFCVSVAHAEFMADVFNKNALPALCVTGETAHDVRLDAPRRLRAGEVCVLVTVDLYNEGVDLPFVDTLLFLRPTQSALVFQQQLGRGLRLSEGKTSCLVLDFVGHHRADFRFDRLLSGITGLTRRELELGIKEGFSTLPAGCHLQLQPQTRTRVLASLRSLSVNRWPRLAAELQAYAALKGHHDFTMAEFVTDQGLDIVDVYRQTEPAGWTALRRAAGLVASEPTSDERYLGRRYADLLHIDAPNLLELLSRIDRVANEGLSDSLDEPVLLQALTYQIDGESTRVGSYTGLLDRLRAHPAMAHELTEMARWLSAKSRVRDVPLPWHDATPNRRRPPLTLHAHYKLREILTAVGVYTDTARPRFGEGVLRLHDRQVEVLFVTLDKREGFHDAIAYRDYAIDPTHFHWQTQNSAGPTTGAGLRYLESPGNGWTFQLFVRARSADAYLACGPVRVVDHEGEKPMSLRFELGTPLPPEVFSAFSVLRDA